MNTTSCGQAEFTYMSVSADNRLVTNGIVYSRLEILTSPEMLLLAIATTTKADKSATSFYWNDKLLNPYSEFHLN